MPHVDPNHTFNIAVVTCRASMHIPTCKGESTALKRAINVMWDQPYSSSPFRKRSKTLSYLVVYIYMAIGLRTNMNTHGALFLFCWDGGFGEDRERSM